MMLGEKIKRVRTQNGFTREELAEKLMASRQAITKWEADKGIPDVSNLKMLAQVLNVSVDYLLDGGEAVYMNVIRESTDLSQYGKSMMQNALTDRLVRDKFPQAEIHTLLAKKKMDKADKTVDTVLWSTTSFVNAIEILNSLKLHGIEYYLVNDGNRQFLVEVDCKEDYMETHRIVEYRSTRNGDRFIIGNLIFTVGMEIRK